LSLYSSTFCQAYDRRAVLIGSAPDSQLAVAVVPPAPEAAVARHSTYMTISPGDDSDEDAW